jgi:hypothetical protein
MQASRRHQRPVTLPGYGCGMDPIVSLPFVAVPLLSGMPPPIVLPLGDATGVAYGLCVALLSCVAALFVAQARRHAPPRPLRRDPMPRAMPRLEGTATPRRIRYGAA